MNPELVFLLMHVLHINIYVNSVQLRSDDTNQLTVVVEQLSANLAKMEAQLNAQRETFEKQLVMQATRIAELEASQNRTVAFSAYVQEEPGIAGSKDSIIPFRSVIANTGGAYNPSSSVFTAPVNGDYFFIVHADCSRDYRSMYVTVNGRRVFAAENDGLADHHVTGSGLVTLQVGDVVSVWHLTSGGVVDAGDESTFSGFMVK